MSFQRIVCIAAALGILGTSGLWSGSCSAEAPAGTKSPSPVVQGNAAPLAIADLNWTVPESGTSEEYYAFIGRVQNIAARPRNYEEAKELFNKQASAIAGACDKIIAMQQLDDPQILNAVSLKINQYLRLMNYNMADKSTELLAISDQLKAAGRAELAKDYLETPRLFLFTAYAAKNDFESFNKLEAKLELQAEESGDNLTVETAFTIRRVMELMKGEDKEKYNAMIDKFSDLFVKAKDANVVRLGKRMMGEKRFANLSGSEIQLGGKLLDGAEFSYDPYKGKVVLIDFWATWCGPCVGEIPNVKKMYEAYHDKGFDVVGISCDRDKKQLQKFLKDRDIPWAQMLDTDTIVEESTLCDYYGVNGIPTMVLVGKDGKVISTSARGPELKRLLAEQFGPLPEEPQEEK